MVINRTKSHNMTNILIYFLLCTMAGKYKRLYGFEGVRNDKRLSYFLELIPQPVQLNGGADAVHYFYGGEEEPVGLGGAGLGGQALKLRTASP